MNNKPSEAATKEYKVSTDLKTIDKLFEKIEACTDADSKLKSSMFRRNVVNQVPLFRNVVKKIYSLKSNSSTQKRGEDLWSYTKQGSVLDKMWSGVYGYLKKNEAKKNPTVLDKNKKKCTSQFLKAINFLMAQANTISNFDMGLDHSHTEDDMDSFFENINPNKFSDAFNKYKSDKKQKTNNIY